MSAVADRTAVTAGLGQRAREEKRLRALARKLRKAADLVDVAATYWGDGAYSTTRGILTDGRTRESARTRSAVSHILEVARNLNRATWTRHL